MKMETIGKIFLSGGLFVTVISQIYIIVLGFRFSFSEGLYCLLITPIYAFVSDMRKEDSVRKALGVWVTGFMVFLLSILALAAI
jgi:hypothetical protein